MERRLQQSQNDITDIYEMLDGIKTTLAGHGRHLGRIDTRLGTMEMRFTGRLDTVDARLDKMETTLDDMEVRFSARLDRMDASLGEVLAILRGSQPNPPN